MKLRTLAFALVALLALLALAVGFTSIDHPIILKWVTGSARHFGKPMNATVFVDGKVNDQVKVFYTDEPDNYLLSFVECDTTGMLKFLNIDLNKKLISQPVAKSADDHDFIAGHLFQSKAVGQFSPYQADQNDFDPRLSITGDQIRLDLPPNALHFDSIRIEMN